jgi:hypothetical protein
MSINHANSVQADAKVEIDRIAQSQNAQILEQMIAYAAGYLRCACDQQLITQDHWVQLTGEIEVARQAWERSQAENRAAHHASAQIEVNSTLNRKS